MTTAHALSPGDQREAEALAVQLVATGTLEDPYAVYARLREIAPVFRCESLNGMWLVTGHAECAEAIHSPALGQGPKQMQRISQDPRLEGSRYLQVLQDMLPFIDPPQHTRLRGLVARAFTARRVEQLRPRLKDFVNSQLDRLESAGGAGGQADLVADFAEAIPVTAICEMVGVPGEYHGSFIEWTRKLAEASGPVVSDTAIREADIATGQFGRVLAELEDARRRDPQDDMLTDLIRAEQNGERLNHQELHATFMAMIGAGVETAVNLMASTVMALQRFPGAAGQIRDTPVDDDALADEFLRYDPPFQTTFPRVALQDTEVAGQRLTQWEVVTPVIGAAGRDPRAYEAPDEVRLGRPRMGKPLGFGGGLHYCLGAAIARLEVNTAVPALLRRFPELAVAGQPLRRGNMMVRGIGKLPVQLAG